MTNQAAKFDDLAEDLANSGWSIVAKSEPESAGMIRWLWTLESNWSPVGFTLYLGFLYDPQNHGTTKANDIWGVKILYHEPLDQGEDLTINIGRKWSLRRKEIINTLDQVRVSKSN
jgi:hypothetical protein